MNAKIFKMNSNQKFLEILKEIEDDVEIHNAFFGIIKNSFSNKTKKITSPEKFLSMLFLSKKDENLFEEENKKLVDSYLLETIYKEGLSKKFSSISEIENEGNKKDKFLLSKTKSEITRRNKVADKEYNRSLNKETKIEKLNGLEDSLTLCSIGSKESYRILWSVGKVLTHKKIGPEKELELIKYELGS